MPTPPAMDYQFYPTMEECHQNGGFKTTNGINGIQQQQHQIQNNVLPKATTSSSTSSFSSSSNKLANQNSSCNNSSNDSLTDAVHVGGGGAGMNSNKLMRVKSLENCRVCGDGPARMHYSVPTCFGCKGFFRRTLKRTKEYTCRYNGNCVVDRYERNSCRYCRFKRCLEVGMDPKAVRPDRDAAGRTHPIRHKRIRNTPGELAVVDEEEAEGGGGGMITDDWIRKMPVEMRTLLMQLLNVDLMVANGDTMENAKNLYPLPFESLHQILEDPACLDGKRTEMRYEQYRQVESSELTSIAHRRLIATIDTVDHLCTLMDLHSVEDKKALVKFAYAPLTIYSAVAATAKITKNRNILCLCNSGYVPRGAHDLYDEPYHFANHLVDRCLDELIEPFRAFNFKDQEVVLMKYIVLLNPHLRTLSTEASEQIADFRDRVQETLYNVVRESHPKEVPSSRFGNLLLFLPNILILGNVMYENLQFIQSFRNKSIGPLMNELLDDTIEPIDIKDVHFDDHTSVSSDDTPMRHSQSAESLSSMASHGSHASFDQWQQQNNFLEFYAAGRRVSMSVHDLQSQDRLMSQQSGSDGRDSKFQLCSNDSDPDYNITLTADSFRNVQTMEVDSREQQPPEFQQQQGVQECRPQFFIDSAGGGGIFQGGQQQQQQFNPQMQNHPPTSTTITGHGHHVFTVEKTDANALPMNSHQCRQMLVNGGQQTMVSAERQQPTIIQKSQSYPFTAEQADSITSIPTSASSDRFH